MTASVFIINYPAANPMPVSKGRNGLIKTAGVHVEALAHDPLVQIRPITSQDNVTDSCVIAVPHDKATLQLLANAFAQLAATAP